MDKFYQIITELWPLIKVQNSILLNIIRGGGGYHACLQRFYLLPRFPISEMSSIKLASVAVQDKFVFGGAPIAQLGGHQNLDRKVAGLILTRGAVLCP